jgi:hypothetical protein
MNLFVRIIVVLLVLANVKTAFAEEQSNIRYVSPEKENLRATANGKKIGELQQGTKVEVIEKKGKWIKVRIDGWLYAPSASSKPIKKNQTSTSDVEYVKSKIERLPSDFSRDSKPYGAHVRAYFQFRNNTAKTLTGLVYETTFMDSFGDTLYKAEMKDQLKVPSGRKNSMDTFWYWEDNPFIDDQPYDKLQSAAGAGTIKVKVKLKKAVFSDGTVVTF